MKYKMSNEVNDILTQCPNEVATFMKCCLERYFETGEEFHFTHDELKDFWFYLKIHELANRVQRYGYYSSWYGTFDHIELQSELGKNAMKFLNKRFRLGAYDGNSKGKSKRVNN